MSSAYRINYNGRTCSVRDIARMENVSETTLMDYYKRSGDIAFAVERARHARLRSSGKAVLHQKGVPSGYHADQSAGMDEAACEVFHRFMASRKFREFNLRPGTQPGEYLFDGDLLYYRMRIHGSSAELLVTMTNGIEFARRTIAI